MGAPWKLLLAWREDGVAAGRIGGRGGVSNGVRIQEAKIGETAGKDDLGDLLKPLPTPGLSRSRVGLAQHCRRVA